MAWTPPPPPSGAPTIEVGGVRALVPGPASEGLEVGRSNNNVDLAWFEGRLFLAWRTAPDHFAGAEARLHVVSSSDGGETWRHETTVAQGRDVREPRLCPWRGELLLFWFTAGTRGTAFTPDRVWVRALGGGGTWSEPAAVSPTDCIVWRVRPVDGRLVLSTYRGASTLYTAHPEPTRVELWVGDDGRRWEQLDPDHPLVHDGGTETEHLQLRDGRVLAVVRKEGPHGGWGHDIGVADGESPARFAWRSGPEKLDSPLLIEDRGRVLLLCRRTTAFDGHYDLGWSRPRDPHLRTRLYQGLYWATPKRTAVYQVDPDDRTLTWLTDLPSAGDTAFAAAVPADPDRADDGRWLVANYSSPFDRVRWPWLRGQLGPTRIHGLHLTVSPPH